MIFISLFHVFWQFLFQLTNRRMRSNCNGGSGVIPSQPYSNMKSEDNEDDGCVDEDDEDENDVEQPSIADIEKMNNNNGCDQICQPSDDDKQKFDQIDIQSNVRFVVEPQSTFGIHPRNSINTVTETHMRPVSSMSLPPNSLISSLNTVENEYLPHIQPVLVSHISSTTKPDSPSNSQLIHYPRSSHQPSLNSSSVSPFTCNNSVINSKVGGLTFILSDLTAYEKPFPEKCFHKLTIQHITNTSENQYKEHFVSVELTLLP